MAGGFRLGSHEVVAAHLHGVALGTGHQVGGLGGIRRGESDALQRTRRHRAGVGRFELHRKRVAIRGISRAIESGTGA